MTQQQTSPSFQDPQWTLREDNPYKDVSMDTMLRRQNTLAALEQEWEENPNSWQTPEECMWNRGLIQRFEEDYEEIRTLLDTIIHYLPSVSEEFQAMMMCNLAFKKEMADPLFPALLKHDDYKVADKELQALTNRRINLIVQEVIDFLNSQSIPLSLDPSLVTIPKFLPEA